MMKMESLSRYRRLYRRSARMGADRIFNAFVGLPLDEVVPLSISHGVDFCHLHSPLDIGGAEPIHWAYNDQIYARASKVKPTIFAPHPWLMLAERALPGRSIGTLVVAAPPGPENDQNLFEALKKRRAEQITILVKPRGPYLPSIAYWKSQGFQAITAGAEGRDFYLNLYAILSGATRVIGCNLSSALIFAAAIGKEVEIVRNYSHRTYMQKISQLNYQSEAVRKVALTLIHGSTHDATATARELLGGSRVADSTAVLGSYLSEIERLNAPVFFNKPHTRLTKHLLAESARLVGRVGVVNNLRLGISDLIFGREIYATKIDELSLWHSGDAAKYCEETRVKYKKGKTEGGLAVSTYSD